MSDTFLYEAMRTYKWPPASKNPILKIRLWIKLKAHDEDINEFEVRFMDYLVNIQFAYKEALSNSIAEEFEKELAAVEVTDNNGAGIVVYTSWP